MNRNMVWLKKGAELLVFGAMAGVVIAGCGGGTGSSGSGGAVPSPSSTALGSYISDELGTGFNGDWYTGSATSATANTTSMAATASPTVFSVTYTPKALANGSWSDTALATGSDYDLSPTGWTLGSRTGQTLQDSGDGSNAVLNIPGGASYTFSIAKTDLQGNLIGCLSSTGPCATTQPTYPAGAYRYAETYTSDIYMLFNLSSGLQVTDRYGAALTSLPAVGTTFCDPLLREVYQAQAFPSFNNYDVFSTAGCTAPAITTALLAAPAYSVTISAQPTGNSVVPSVLLVTNWWPALWLTDFIYGYRAGYVWEGVMEPAGTNWTVKNKAAINAELVANGYPPVP